MTSSRLGWLGLEHPNGIQLVRESWRTDEARINKHILSALGDVPALEMSRVQVIELNQKIGATDCGSDHCRVRRKAKAKRDGTAVKPCTGHPEANRNVRLIQRIYEVARDRELIPQNHPNPAARFSDHRFKETPKVECGERAAEPDEVRRLVPAIWANKNRSVRAAFWLALFTGMRKQEILGLRWDWINLTKRTKTLPDRVKLPPHTLMLPAETNKPGRTFFLPLSGAAVEVIRCPLPKHD